MRAAASLLLLCGSTWANVPLGGTLPGTLTVPMTPPDDCQNCHKFEEAAPYDSWAGSMKANAARDPLFLGALAIANQDVNGVGDFCIRCHAPQALLEGRAIPEDGSAMTETDREGVHCEFCHRITLGETGEVLLGNGQYTVANDQVRRGPYSYPASNGFVAPHGTAVSDLHAEARLCGICHDVTNPFLNLRDESGVDQGFLAPIERTYSEWAQSAYPAMGVTCQECHMREVEGKACRPIYGSPTRPEMSRHDFAGGNAWVPEVLAGEYPDLDRAESFAYTKRRATEMLAGAATVEILAPTEATAGETIEVRVRTTNLTGHKLPTGYPEGRRMWLRVAAHMNGAEPFWMSGDYDANAAELTIDDQTKIYEVRQAVWDGAAPQEGFHFVLNDVLLLDNRIPPLAFVPNEETRPRGYGYPALPDGALPNYDDTIYTLGIPQSATEDVILTVELLYQTTSREYVEFVRDENATDATGDKLFALWEKYGQAPPVLMAEASATIANPLARVVDEGLTESHPEDSHSTAGCGCELGARIPR